MLQLTWYGVIVQNDIGMVMPSMCTSVKYITDPSMTEGLEGGVIWQRHRLIENHFRR
jgi:hypothetical protein